MPFDRRTFLVFTLGAAFAHRTVSAGQKGLEAFGADTLTCVLDVKATPSVSADNYRAGAPTRTSIAGPGRKGTPLEVTGVVAGLSCGPIAGAVLEFWQPDTGGIYDTTGFNFRGRQVTDSRGRYTLTTVIPGTPPNRAPSIGVHVIVEKKAELWTAMFFPGQAANARDPRFKEELLVKLGGTDATRVAMFDIRLNL